MKSAWLVAAVFTLTSSVMGIAGVVFDTLIQRSIPSHMLARVGSVEQTLIGAMVPLGLAITLPVTHWLGRNSYLISIACIMLVTGCVVGALWGRRDVGCVVAAKEE